MLGHFKTCRTVASLLIHREYQGDNHTNEGNKRKEDEGTISGPQHRLRGHCFSVGAAIGIDQELI